MPAMIENVHVIGSEFGCLIQGNCGLFRLFLCEFRHPQPHPSLGVGRIELDLEAQRGNGGLVLIQPVMSDPEEQICSPQTRIQAHRFLETRDSIFKPALFFPDQAKIEMSSYKSWRGIGDVLESGGGFLQATLAHGGGGQLKSFIDVSATLRRGLNRPASYET